MHPFPLVLAHGALGPFDEIIFLGVGVVFLVLMGISWLRSRDQNDSGDPAVTTQADTYADEPIVPTHGSPTSEHFSLD